MRHVVGHKKDRTLSGCRNLEVGVGRAGLKMTLVNSLPWNWKLEQTELKQLKLELETAGLKTPLVNSRSWELKQLDLELQHLKVE